MKLVFLWMCALVVERSASFMGNVSRAFCRLAPPLGSGFIGISGRCLGNQSEPHLVAENGIRKAM
jgi:hypothetical protein